MYYDIISKTNLCERAYESARRLLLIPEISQEKAYHCGTYV
jgi:hypothetical protein